MRQRVEAPTRIGFKNPFFASRQTVEALTPSSISTVRRRTSAESGNWSATMTPGGTPEGLPFGAQRRLLIVGDEAGMAETPCLSPRIEPATFIQKKTGGFSKSF